MLKNYAKGDTSVSYTYDSNGVRLSKTVNDVLHSYFVNGTQILSEKIGDEVYTYLYEATGIAGIRHNDKYYYFLKTQQGDIKYIVDGDGILQAEYVYDAWGNCKIMVNGVDITDNSEYNTHIAKVNPFRYRGYYFDAETGLYYLNSRYYDPQIRRFINADDPSIPVLEQATDIGGLNLYSYCLNNPANMVDPSGHFALSTFLISFAVSMLISWTASAILGEQIAGGAASVANGASAIYTGASLLSFGPVGWVAGGILMLVGAGTVLFGANEIAAGITGTNYIQQWTGISDDLYSGLYLGLNIVSSIGTIAGNAYTTCIRANALKGIENASYGPKASSHIGERSYYDSIITKKLIIKHGKIYKATHGVSGYEFRIKGGYVMGKDGWQSITTQGFTSKMNHGTWSLVYGDGIIWHFLLN